jgi:hypothetical protein
MSSSQHYVDAVPFRQALETRLRQRTLDRGEDLQRLRQQVVFDRFVTRIQYDGVNRWILKGETSAFVRAVPASAHPVVQSVTVSVQP